MGSVFSCIVCGGDPVVAFAPVRLHERGVDVGGGDGVGLGAHRLHEAGGGEVDGVAQDAAAAGGDQVEGGGVQTAVGESAAVELAQDERFDVVWSERLQQRGERDAALQVFVDGEGELGE